jgi:indole-3-glycerol phosphate synthase
MKDFLDKLGRAAQKTVNEGYYRLDSDQQLLRTSHPSLQKCIREAIYVPIIAEVKLASPSIGRIREAENIGQLATALKRGGAVALSVLTEPKYFLGSITRFSRIRESVNLPLLMKDIIISPRQIDTAAAIGADAILLIQALFHRGYCELDLNQMIDYAQALDLEVLLETHTEEEFTTALDTPTNLVGINNRDLSSLQVDIQTTTKILQKIRPKDRLETKVIVSESGITGPQDIYQLHQNGVHAFLVGSTIMKASNPEETLRKLVMAI